MPIQSFTGNNGSPQNSFKFLTAGRPKPTHVRNLGVAYTDGTLPAGNQDTSLFLISRQQFSLANPINFQAIDYILALGQTIILDGDIEWWALALPDALAFGGTQSPVISVEFSDTTYGFFGSDNSTIESILSNAPTAAQIAAAIYNQGVIAQDTLNGAVANPVVGQAINVQGFVSFDFGWTVSSVSGQSGVQDIYALEVQFTGYGGHLISAETISGQGTGYGTAVLNLPPGTANVTINFVPVVSTSGHAYTCSLGMQANRSYFTRQPLINVINDYWESNYSALAILNADMKRNAYGIITLTNTSANLFPSYRRGPQNIGLLLDSAGSAGATMEFAIREAISAFWLDGIVSTPATVAVFSQFTCNLDQQPSLFIKTTSTLAQIFQYSQVAEN